MNRISEISRLQRLFPLWCLRHHLPAPLGSVSHDSQVALLPYESGSLATAVRWDYNPPRSNHFISISRHSIARTSPSGGSTAAGGDRGAFPTPPGRLHVLPSPARAVVWFYTNWRRSRLPPPSEPCEPFEPSEPSGKLRFPVL